MHSVTADLRRALTTRGFFIGICLTPLVMLLGAGQSVLPVLLHGAGDGLMNGFHASLDMEGTASDAMLFAAPILCALPYTVSFVDDMKSGYIKSCLPRIGKESYVKGKAVACFLSGGFVLFVGVWLAYLLFALTFTPMELAPTLVIGTANTVLVRAISIPSTITRLTKRFLFMYPPEYYYGLDRCYNHTPTPENMTLK